MKKGAFFVTWKWQKERAASLGVRSVQHNQHHETRQKHRISWCDEDAVALLIDADNMQAHSIGLFQSLAERLGSLPVQWVYGNWYAGNLKPWQQVLATHRLEKRKCGSMAYGKNAADITLTRDTMLLYAEGIRKFVLVASDSDYTPLVSWLCMQGCLVVVIGKANTHHALQQAASAFHLLDHLVLSERLVPVYERLHATRTVVLSRVDRVIGHAFRSEEAMSVPMPLLYRWNAGFSNDWWSMSPHPLPGFRFPTFMTTSGRRSIFDRRRMGTNICLHFCKHFQRCLSFVPIRNKRLSMRFDGCRDSSTVIRS